MYQKRKKFKEESTPEKRLSDRWDQQVFFTKKSFPQSEDAITKITEEFSAPSEEALEALARLNASLRG